jgi:L-fuculose-phosphate aldolase
MNTDNFELKQQIILACRKLEELGYVVGTYGNVSARVDGGLIITPSRVDYTTLTPEDLVTVSLDGDILEGHRLPSSELEVHRFIYVARPDVGAVVHTHSLYATAASCTGKGIPVIVEEQSQVIGDAIRCTNYVPAGQHAALGEEVARALGSSNAVLLANHGTVSCGRNMDEALFTARITERVAQMYLLASAAGGVQLIPPEHVASEHHRYRHKYGTALDRVQTE